MSSSRGKGVRLSLGYLHDWFWESAMKWGHRYAVGTLDAEDVANESLLRVAEKRWPDRPTASRFHKGALCRTDPAFINVALMRQAAMLCRHERRRRPKGRPSLLLPGVTSDPVTRAAISEALAALTARELAAVEAKAGGRNLAEVAALTGTSRATACRLLQSAASRIGPFIEDHHGE